MYILIMKVLIDILKIITVNVVAQKCMPSADPRRLQVGTKRPHPSHIPDYMPAFPDPHTYIRSVVCMHQILLPTSDMYMDYIHVPVLGLLFLVCLNYCWW